jgi:hypothetical protein
VKAITNGFSVAHFILDDLLHAVKADAAIPPARLKAKRHLNSALIVIDEVGFRPLGRVDLRPHVSRFKPIAAFRSRGDPLQPTASRWFRSSSTRWAAPHLNPSNCPNVFQSNPPAGTLSQ